MWAKLNGALAGSILPIIFCLVYDIPRGIFGLNPFSLVYLIGIYVACYVYVNTEKRGPTAKGCGETAALMAVVNGLFLSVVALFSVIHSVDALFKVLYSYVPLLIIGSMFPNWLHVRQTVLQPRYGFSGGPTLLPFGDGLATRQAFQDIRRHDMDTGKRLA